MAKSVPAPLTQAEVKRHFVDGVTVFVSGGTGQPDALIDMIDSARLSSRLRIIDNSLPTMTQLNPSQFSSEAILNTGFFVGAYREYYSEGKVEFVPAFHSSRFRAIDEEYGINIVLLKLSEPDAEGYCSAGLQADYSQVMLDRADLIIAEINSSVPYIEDGLKIPLSDIAYSVTSEAPLLEYGVAAASETDIQIASSISELVEDGDCLQLGIGALPVAILENLSDKQDLGIHTGLLTEAVMPLVEAGVVTGRKKTIDKGKVVTGVAAGSSEFYRWCSAQSDLCMRPVNYTHNSGILAQIDNLVAINTTIEIDLFGQFNSETIGGRQIGGGGGLIDFLRGAQDSKGGRSILALHSTAKKGSLSKIVPLLNQAPLTGMRSDIEYVVTEYGVARLANLSVEKRAEALISVTHPDFRDELARQWSDLLSKI